MLKAVEVGRIDVEIVELLSRVAPSAGMPTPRGEVSVSYVGRRVSGDSVCALKGLGFGQRPPVPVRARYTTDQARS